MGTGILAGLLASRAEELIELLTLFVGQLDVSVLAHAPILQQIERTNFLGY
jgi:hypothetical protein